MTPTLGIDIGGVIMDRANDKSDTSFFSQNYLQTTCNPGMFEAVKELVDIFGADNVWIVSKAGARTQARSLEWLAHHDFYKRTGFKFGNVKFCLERHEKAPICITLGITHFIDDKIEVMGYLESVSKRFCFGVSKYELDKYKGNTTLISKLCFIRTWPETVAAIKNTLPKSS